MFEVTAEANNSEHFGWLQSSTPCHVNLFVAFRTAWSKQGVGSASCHSWLCASTWPPRMMALNSNPTHGATQNHPCLVVHRDVAALPSWLPRFVHMQIYIYVCHMRQKNGPADVLIRVVQQRSRANRVEIIPSTKSTFFFLSDTYSRQLNFGMPTKSRWRDLPKRPCSAKQGQWL